MKGGTKKIVVIKLNKYVSTTPKEVRKFFFEQAKTGVVVVDNSVDIYNIEVQDDIEATEVKVEIAGGENE